MINKELLEPGGGERQRLPPQLHQVVVLEPGVGVTFLYTGPSGWKHAEDSLEKDSGVLRGIRVTLRDVKLR